MTRTLTITAAEWASVQDGTLWLVREGAWMRTECHCNPKPPTLDGQHSPHCNIRRVATPPAEFVQAYAPCRCKGTNLTLWDGMNPQRACRKCRIELVGPCLLCGGSGRTLGGPLGEDVGDCRCAMTEGSMIFGYGYAVGEPLPILAYPDCGLGEDDPHICYAADDGVILALPDGDVLLWAADDETKAAGPLVHYGPPESLVGKWALRVQVVR